MLPVLGTSDVTAVEFKFVPEKAKLLSQQQQIHYKYTIHPDLTIQTLERQSEPGCLLLPRVFQLDQ